MLDNGCVDNVSVFTKMNCLSRAGKSRESIDVCFEIDNLYKHNSDILIYCFSLCIIESIDVGRLCSNGVHRLSHY